MKKLKIISTVLLFALAVVSCDMVPWDQIDSLEMEPTEVKKVPKLYPGGNVECNQLNSLAEKPVFGLSSWTTGRNNYNPSTDSFESNWPSWLLVNVTEDKSISFQIDGTIDFGDNKCYKVGAVIVKGSNASNIYDYTDLGGVLMDAGLYAPDNSSGEAAALSNLTFCFVECNTPQLIISLKAGAVATPSGADGYVSTTNDGINLGYYNITPNILNTFKVFYYGNLSVPVGDMTVRDYVDEGDGIRYLEVVVDNKYRTNILFYQVVYLYVGLVDGFTTTYTSFPFTDIAETFPSSTMTFKIPYSDI